MPAPPVAHAEPPATPAPVAAPAARARGGASAFALTCLLFPVSLAATLLRRPFR